MATLSQVGIPGVGFGILHPMMKYRFMATFKNPNGERLEYADTLSRQFLRASNYTQTKDGSGGEMHIVIEADITCTASAAIQKLLQEESFIMELIMLDGNETIVETTTFTGCEALRVVHSDVDYAGGPSRPAVRFRLVNPTEVGSAIEAMKEDPAAWALYTAMKSIRLEVEDWDPGTGGRCVVEKAVYLTYTNVAVTINI